MHIDMINIIFKKIFYNKPIQRIILIYKINASGKLFVLKN